MIIDDLEVLELVIQDRCWLALYDQPGKWPRLAFKLLLHAFHLIQVDVTVPPGPDEVAGLEIALLRHHAGQEGILRYVEDLPHRRIARPLEQQAGQASTSNVELEKRVA